MSPWTPADPRARAPATLAVLLAALAGCAGDPPPDPGERVLHRLNRTEYDRTVRDLFGTTQQPARDFPADDFGFGFDNVATALSLSPLHIELHERAADLLLAEAFAPPGPWPLDLRASPGDEQAVDADSGYGTEAGHWVLTEAGGLRTTMDVPLAGVWFVGVEAFEQAAGSESARLDVRLDGASLGTFEAGDEASSIERYGAEATLTAGPHALEVVFLNDYWAPATGADRNLVVAAFVLQGPYGVERPPSARERLLPCEDDGTPRRTCAAATIRAFADRAWRRPIAEEDLLRLLAVHDAVRADGGDLAEGVQAAMKAALLSPRFLFRVERDADPTDPTPRPLDPYELASRLSYFLWSSMPDDALFAAAADDALGTDDALRAQVRRMLADPKADALVQSFAGQWLYVRAVDDAAPDGATWPDFDATLRASMKEEIGRFFASFVTSDRAMVELLTATEGELDARLAAHYGVSDFEAPSDGGFAPHDWAGTQRGGILGMGGILTATSYPLRTSPTRRGKWVMEQLLCQAPPPPPPGVEGLPEEGGGPTPATLRERLAQHATDPTCASCHVRMDAIGFALEHFDPVGVWRDEEAGQPIDATATLEGESLDGARDLAEHLARDRSLTRCMTQQLYTYALGRGPGDVDWRWINAAHDAFEAGGLRFAALAEAIVLQPTFRTRRPGDAVAPAEASP